MPTYEYECSQCGQIFDHSQSIKSPPLTDCLDPACGGKGTMKRLISDGVGVIFKGSGFYATDYKRPTHGGPKKHDGETAPCASCSEAKSCPAATKE
jgi:putative FmdB family regulatory protein